MLPTACCMCNSSKYFLSRHICSFWERQVSPAWVYKHWLSDHAWRLVSTESKSCWCAPVQFVGQLYSLINCDSTDSIFRFAAGMMTAFGCSGRDKQTRGLVWRLKHRYCDESQQSKETSMLSLWVSSVKMKRLHVVTVFWHWNTTHLSTRNFISCESMCFFTVQNILKLKIHYCFLCALI